jgi:hypothetical protein
MSLLPGDPASHPTGYPFLYAHEKI